MAIYINTNQNVNIEYEISGLNKRVKAYAIDLAITLGLALVFGFIGGFISLNSSEWLVFIFVTVPMFFYHLICELTMNGQSVGKRSAKIKVMKTDGRSASFVNYFLRFLLRPIDSIYFIGLVFIFFTSKSQRLGDLAAGTVIVNVKEEVTLSNLTESMKATKDEITYQEVDRLRDKDIEIIRKVLNSWKHQQSHENVLILAEKVKSLLEVDPKTEPYLFLKRVVRDYHAMYG